MKWYLAKLVYRIICGEGAHTPQFDEQLRLVCAEDDLHAFQKARATGHLERRSGNLKELLDILKAFEASVE
jgi:hypothetical protein